ncbi:polyketide cyclase [Nakamurella sp. YIM 132087]|uniref:Polyketide cyclase n=1 Tax=Nakamurella alba TaxID=2665158 RepID=A0A7K1FQS9_9ACTN|nr:SRPBCC domain-containing protein [Nakamurella alba]MTD16430.1 polyketide cyclase [Nakamurella alba]
MEMGSIHREMYVEASPEVVFEVLSSPEHLREWWSDDAVFDPEPGSAGTFLWQQPDGSTNDVQMAVVESDPPRRYAFRWGHDAGETATHGNSLLVTFDLVPTGSGTTIRLVETGFRERGWEVAVLEQQYREHEGGWTSQMARFESHLLRVVSMR